MHDMQQYDETTKQKGKRGLGVTLGMLQTPPLEGIAPRDSQEEEKKDGYSERS